MEAQAAWIMRPTVLLPGVADLAGEELRVMPEVAGAVEAVPLQVTSHL